MPGAKQWTAWVQHQRIVAAEDRVRELEAHCAAATSECDEAESELTQLRERVARVKTLYERLPAIPQYAHLKLFATDVMATLEGWPQEEA